MEQTMNNSNLTKEQFYNMYASKKLKSNVKWFMIICFITAGISIVMLAMGNVFSILDMIFYGVFGFIILKKKDMIYPLIVTIYSGVFSVIAMAQTGTPSGIVALVVGIASVIGLNKVKKAYEVYLQTGQVPETEIQ